MAKRFMMILYVFFLVTVMAHAEQDPVLVSIDAMVSFPGDFSAEYTITQIRPGRAPSKTVAAIFRRDAEQKYLILVLSPEQDRGKGYLKIEDGLWLYQPRDKAFTYTSSKERFQNSNARNSDFTRSDFAGNYRVMTSSKQKLGKFECTVYDLEAITEGVEYPYTTIWVSPDNLVRKTEDFSLSREKLRMTLIPSYQRVGDRNVPVSLTIIDMLKGSQVNGEFENEQTKIEIAKPTLKALPATIYTKEYLKKIGTR